MEAEEEARETFLARVSMENLERQFPGNNEDASVAWRMQSEGRGIVAHCAVHCEHLHVMDCEM